MRWLWVAKIDFMNTKKLVEELSKISHQLSNEEKVRNSFHHIEIFFPLNHFLRKRGKAINNSVVGNNGEDGENVSSSTPTTAAATMDDDVTSTKHQGSNQSNPEDEWRPLIGGSLDGWICSPQPVSTSSTHDGRYYYKFSSYQVNRSLIHPYFITRPLPMMWTVLQASLPNRPVRLPVNYEQLTYIVRTHGGAVEETAMSPTSYYHGGGYSGGRGGGGGYNGGGGYRGGGGGKGKGGKGADNVCWYFNSPNGCGYGANCRFSHISSS